MTQFDPNMVAQMLMQPVGRESLSRSISDENYFEPIEIPSPDRVAPLDMQGGFFIDPETAGKVAYGGAVTGASFLPGAGVVDAAGGAVDVFGQPLPSFGENIRQGDYFDAALQGLGVAGDVATVAAPLTLGASAVLGAMLKAPRTAQKISKATDVASDIGSIAKVEPPTETNVLQFDAEKQKVQKPANQNLLPRDTTSGHAADGVPAQFGPPAHDMNLKIDEEFTPEGFSTFSTNVGDDYENLKFFVSSSRGTKEYQEEVAFLRKLKEIKGNPDAEVTVYRASPTDDLRSGDLITPIKSDAEFYVEESKITRDDIIKAQRKARLDSDEPIDLKKEKMFRTMDEIIGLFPEPEVSVSKVHTYKVKAKDIRWDGNNGLIRWGYFPDTD